MRKIIFLIAIIIILAVVVTVFYKDKSQNRSDEMPLTQEEPLLQPPSEKIYLYKGFWMPCGFLGGNCQSMASTERLKEAGANIALIAPIVKINSRGEVKFDAPVDQIERRLAEQVKEYYKQDIRVGLAIEMFYADEFDGRSGEPKPIPANITQKAGFLDKYNLIVADVAKLAERYKVEIFSPLNEPDLKLGEAIASEWGQKILPAIKENYHGKVLWKAAGGALDKYNTNFKGYDIIGFDPTPGGQSFEQSIIIYKDYLKRLLNIAQNRAKRDNIFEIMVTEFGVWGGAINFSEEQKALAHRAVFELAKDKVSGFIVLDPPTDLDRPLYGTKTFEEVKSWFKEKLIK